MDIKELREQINEIDEEIVKLFTERMDVSTKIAAYKKENRGIPLIDWEFLTEHRDGLFVGAACDGEVAAGYVHRGDSPGRGSDPRGQRQI